MPLVVGPALEELLAAQQEEDDALAYPLLRGYAAALAELSRRVRSPLLWPVGAAAERLAGAALIESGGAMRLRGWNDHLAGERVLLLAGVVVTSLGLYAVADQARRLGVREVMATGIRVDGPVRTDSIDAFFQLKVSTMASRRTA